MGNLNSVIKEAFEIFLENKENIMSVLIIDDNEVYINGENQGRYLKKKASNDYDRFDNFLSHIIKCKDIPSPIYFEANKNNVFLIEDFKESIKC